MSATARQAFKKLNETHLVACDWDDPDAVRFDIRYAGQITCINFDSRTQAEHIEYAMERVFQAGKQAAMRDLRQFIGCACR